MPSSNLRGHSPLKVFGVVKTGEEDTCHNRSLSLNPAIWISSNQAALLNRYLEKSLAGKGMWLLSKSKNSDGMFNLS